MSTAPGQLILHRTVYLAGKGEQVLTHAGVAFQEEKMIEKHYAEAVTGVVIAEAKNGLEVGDIEQMIQFFNANRLPKVALKLPQAEATRVFGQEDGAPALGWVSRIYREGKKLLADFRKVPKIVARVLREGSPRLRVEVGGVDFPIVSTLGEMSVALLSEGSTRRREEPSIDELTRCRIALTGEEYAVGVRQVLKSHPEAARQYFGIAEGRG